MQRAWSLSPSKVRLIVLGFETNHSLDLKSAQELANQGRTNRLFAEFMRRTNLLRGEAVDRESLRKQVRLAVAKTVSDLVALGRRESQKGRYYLGAPLDWSRLSYEQRKGALETVASKFMCDSRGAAEEEDGLVLDIGTAKILTLVHGVPAGFGTVEARELVGRPYLRDHKTLVASGKSKIIGPLHIIACHKSCTESQIISFMGHPDLFLVQAPFGFFVADQTDFVQTFFVTNCRDEAATILGLQRMFDWVEQSDELKVIIERAQSRAHILKAIAKETEKSRGK